MGFGLTNKLISVSNKIQKDYELSSRRLSTGEKSPIGTGQGSLVSLADKFKQKNLGMKQVTSSLTFAKGFTSMQESLLNDVQNLINRLQELAVASADPTKTDSDRAVLNAEFQQLYGTELGNIAGTTYNGVALFGASAGIDVRYGLESTDTTSLNDIDISGEVSFSSGVSAIDTKANAEAVLDDLVSLTNGDGSSTIGTAGLRSKISANNSTIDRYANYVEEYAITMQDNESQIRDINIAEEVTNFTAKQIQLAAVSSMITQANIQSQSPLQFIQNI